MARPNEFPEWAENDYRDEITGQNNVLPPPDEKRLLGFAFKEQPARNWLNWIFRTTCQWLKYFDSEITAIKATSSNTGESVATQISGLQTQITNSASQISSITAEVGDLHDDVVALQTGGLSGMTVVKENGTGFATISQENCSFILQVFPNDTCGTDVYIYATGYRKHGAAVIEVHTQRVITLGTPAIDGKIPIDGHTASHLSASITMIKES